MARNKARSKKGISLAFVIVVVLALMVFSAMLFSAASHSLSMTGDSTDGRQTYLTAKSAIEYAKTVAFRSAKTGELTPFSVGPDGDGYKQLESEAPDGTKTYAQCTNPSGDGKTWKILAKVKYNGADKYRQLAYSFTLTHGDAFSAVNGFVIAGSNYTTGSGKVSVLNNGTEFSGDGTFLYPFVFSRTIQVQTHNVSAPEMYFLNPDTSFSETSGGSTACTLDSNIIFFNGPVSGGSTSPQNAQKLLLKNKSSNRIHLNNGYDGIVWFHNASIKNYGISLKMEDGPYYFKNDTDLFSYDGLKSGKLPLIPVPQGDFDTIDALKAMNLPAKVSYYGANTGKICSSGKDGGVAWTQDGKLSIAPTPQPENDIFMYLSSSVYQQGGFRENLSTPVTYTARSIALQYMGTQDVPFTIPNTAVTFQTGTLWLNGQSEDGYPSDRSKDDDMPAVQGATAESQCFVRSPDGSPVKLILPHGLVVKDVQKKVVYKFDPRRQSGYDANDASTFTYTVPSGTDLLALRNSAGDDAADSGTLAPLSGSGSSGGGSFTITPGQYTNS